MLVYVKDPYLLTSFQRWALIHLHNKEDSSTVMKILKECCITAMDEFFEKKNVIDGLSELEKMELIAKTKQQFDPRPQMNEELEKELGVKYHATADGIIYTKKMLKPVLDLVERGGIEKVAQKLDGKTDSWVKKLINNAKDLSQQEIVQEITKYGLGNINGLSQLLEGLRTT